MIAASTAAGIPAKLPISLSATYCPIAPPAPAAQSGIEVTEFLKAFIGPKEANSAPVLKEPPRESGSTSASFPANAL